MKNIITKEIEYMKYVLGYKRGVVISEQQLTSDQMAKIDANQNNYASTFDREIAASKTPGTPETPKTPVTPETPKTPAVPATLSAADMTTIYNFAIGDTVKNYKVGDNTSLAAIAWLIWTRDDSAKAPENKANIDLFEENFPGAKDGKNLANSKITIAKKYPVSLLPEKSIKIGADYTGVNYSKESSDFGIGKSGKSGLGLPGLLLPLYLNLPVVQLLMPKDAHPTPKAHNTLTGQKGWLYQIINKKFKTNLRLQVWIVLILEKRQVHSQLLNLQMVNTW